MLTRKEAKEKVCPYTYVMLSGNSISSVMNCTAENCPKWKDEFIEINKDKLPCSDKECTVFCNNTLTTLVYLDNCLTCNKHFGKCGG